MQQASPPSTPIPTEFSPEFNNWLKQEKRDAHSHRSRLFKLTLTAVVLVTALVLLKGQPEWVQQIVDVAKHVQP